jgi:septum formation protein
MAGALTETGQLTTPPLVLASSSPRRKRILETIGLQFEVVAALSEAERPWRPGQDPIAFAEHTARAKRDQVAATRPDALVIAADTIVILEGVVLEKPADEDDARAMLARLAGRDHVVCTGVAVVAPSGETVSGTEITGVQFRDLDGEEIADYVATGEPLDKAGAYGIQGFGAALVRQVNGCYFNVMGLPVARLLDLLEEVGWEYRAPGLLRPVGAPTGSR